MPSSKIVLSLVTVAILGTGSLWWYSHQIVPTEVQAQASNTQSEGNQDKGAKESERQGKKKGGRGGGNRPVPVLTATIKKSNIDIVQTAVGTVISPTTVTIKSRVNGQLTKIHFKEGQYVRAGEVLAEIDPRPFQATLTQMEGQALRDQAMLKNSQLDLERFKTLQQQDSIASQQVDAQASLVQQYQGTIRADQGMVDNAKLQLGFTRITAPISGRIGLRQIDVGNNILTTDVLAIINAVNPIEVIFTLPEDRASDLMIRLNQAKKSAQNLAVEAWDKGNTTLLAKGNLKSLDNQIDPTTGTIKLKAVFQNDDALLFPNQFVNIKLLSDTLENIVVAPSAAIQRSNRGEFVYLVEGSGKETKVAVNPVKTGITNGNQIEIKEGLSVDQSVVVSGIDKLRDGAKVFISKPLQEEQGGKNSRLNKKKSHKNPNAQP